MIQEHPYFQYFSGYPGYDDSKLPFDPSLMVYFRKRLTPEVLGKINEMISSTAQKEDNRHDNDDDRGNGGNSGTMVVDATCAPSNIRYPQDASLLNEARESTEKILDELHDPADGRKPRTYRAQAHRDFLQFSRSRQKTAKKIHKAVGKRLRYLARNLAAINQKLALGRTLSQQKTDRLMAIRTLCEQQKYMYENHCHTVRQPTVPSPHCAGQGRQERGVRREAGHQCGKRLDKAGMRFIRRLQRGWESAGNGRAVPETGGALSQSDSGR